MANYDDVFAKSVENPEGFWAEAAEGIDWYKKWDTVLDASNPPFYRWFSGATLNTCYNAVDRHVENGRGDQVAIIHDSPVTGTITKVTYAELQQKVAQLAGALQSIGVVKGDTVMETLATVRYDKASLVASYEKQLKKAVEAGELDAKKLKKLMDEYEQGLDGGTYLSI